jgi:hypothetical protein
MTMPIKAQKTGAKRPKPRSKYRYLPPRRAKRRDAEICAARRGGASLRALATQFHLSPTRVWEIVTRADRHHFANIEAPQIIADHIAAGTQALIPINAILKERKDDFGSFLMRNHRDVKTLADLKSVFEGYTLAHIERFVYKHKRLIDAINTHVGALVLPDQLAYERLARERISHVLADGGAIGDVRYIDFDPRPDAYLTISWYSKYGSSVADVTREISVSEYGIADLAYARGAEKAESDYLMSLCRTHEGPQALIDRLNAVTEYRARCAADAEEEERQARWREAKRKGLFARLAYFIKARFSQKMQHVEP